MAVKTNGGMGGGDPSTEKCDLLYYLYSVLQHILVNKKNVSQTLVSCKIRLIDLQLLDPFCLTCC
jgi:hypothetical protein